MKQHYFKFNNCYKQLLNLFIFSFCFIPSLFSQTYVNGNLGTSATSNNGTAAPAGTMWHELQNDAGNTTESNSTLGVSHASSGASNFTLADDFTVPAGETWNLTKLTIYSLDQVTTSTTSPYTDIRVRIYNGDPSAGGTIIYGDLTTNRFASTGYTSKRAIFNSQVPTPGAPTPDLPIFSIDANLSTTLTAGTYWVEWQVVYTANCFSLTSQTVGVRTMPGYNAIRSNAGVWAPLIDGGTPASAPDVAIDLPFTITYNTGNCSGTPAPGNTISSVTDVCPGTSFDLSVQNATSGSGITYQWQSSPNGITYTNIAGATSPVLSTTLTTATYYQLVVTCSSNPPGTSTPVQVTVTTSTVTTQPTAATATCGGTVNFSTAASGTAVTYQWQQRVSAAAPWTAVVNGLDASTGATFNNATSSNLSITNTSSIMNGYEYRASIIGSCAANIFSNPAMLTVNPLTITVNPSAVNVCSGNTVPVGIAIATVNPSGVMVTSTTPFPSGTLNLGIPDNIFTGITNTIPVSVPAGAVISAASVTLNITHTWVGDMVIALKAPNGNVLNLDYALNGSGGGPDPSTGFTNTVISSAGVNTLDLGTDPWTGVFAPDAPAAPGAVPTAPTTLSPVNANVFTFADLYSTPSGNWTLGILDAGPADVGTLINWTLTLTYTYPQGQPYTGVWTPATGLFTDAALTVPYVAGAQEDSVWTLPTANGSYTVTVTTPTCTAAPVVVPVTVLSAPSITTQPVDVTVCEGANASFTATAAGTSYQWQVSTDGINFTDIAGQTTTTLNLTAVTAGMNNNKYRLVVSSCGPAGLNSNVVTLTVNSAATISTQPASATVCIGNDATFSVTAGGTGTLTYQWAVSTDGGTTYTPITGATSSTLTIPAVTPALNNNLYHVTISNICTASLISNAATLTVSSLAAINTQPVATSACSGSNATFTVGATGPGLSYQWQESTNGGVSFTNIGGATSSTLTLPAVTEAMDNNQYQVVVLSSCSATGVNSDPATLTVFALPVVTISASPYLTLTNATTTTITATSVPSSTTFSWFLGGAPISGQTGPTIPVDHSGLGNYTASITDANGCTGTSNEIVIGDSLLTNVFVYPNPSSGVFYVQFTDSINGVSNLRHVSVFDAKGARVYNQAVTVINEADKMPIDLTHLPKGVYILELTDDSGKRLKTTRLVKL